MSYRYQLLEIILSEFLRVCRAADMRLETYDLAKILALGKGESSCLLGGFSQYFCFINNNNNNKWKRKGLRPMTNGLVIFFSNKLEVAII